MTSLRIGPGPNVIELFRPHFRNKRECLSLASFPAKSNKQSNLVKKYRKNVL
jgi:hypothetical protein